MRIQFLKWKLEWTSLWQKGVVENLFVDIYRQINNTIPYIRDPSSGAVTSRPVHLFLFISFSLYFF